MSKHLLLGSGTSYMSPWTSRGRARGWEQGPCRGCPGGKEAEVRPPWLWAATLVPLVPTPGAQEQLSRATPWAGLSTATLSTGLIWPDPRPYKRHPPGVGWAASLRKSWVGPQLEVVSPPLGFCYAFSTLNGGCLHKFLISASKHKLLEDSL